MPDNNSIRKTKKNLNDYARYSSLVLQMAVIIFLGTFGGMKLDKILHLKFPVLTVVLSLLSVLLSMFIILKDLISKK